MNLTAQQRAVYDFIRDYIREKSFPPTIREIGAALGLRSTSTVHSHVKALAKKGLISICPGAQRTISLTGQGDSGTTEGVRPLPHIGTVAAGQPIFAFDDASMFEAISLPASLVHGADAQEAFILDVKGESMTGAGINSGDMIVVHRGIKAENGDIAVARVAGDTATVKRVFYEKDKIRLQPENPSMEPIYADYGEVEIIGRVVCLIRRY